MPLVLEPNATYEYVLDCDKEKPADKQPTFIFKYLSSREWKTAAKLSDKFDKKLDSAKDGEIGDVAVDAVFEAIKIPLTGWRNMTMPDGREIEFAAEKLEDILTPSEAMELMRAAIDQLPSAKDKKKFDLPSTSSMGRSARRAKDRKIAKTSRRK